MLLKDKLNPVFLREMRRVVRNGVALVALNLFLVVLLALGLLMIYSLLSTGQKLDAEDCYRVFSVAFGGVAIIVIPIMVFARHSSNVRTDSADLLLLTDLRPRQVADGMALTGIMGMLLVLSVTFPVLMMTSLVSSIDVVMVLKLVAVLVGLSVAAIYYAVACGSMRTSAPLRIKAFVLGLPVFALVTFISVLIESDVLNEVKVLEVLFGGIFVTTLCSRLVAEGALSPASANRYAPLHRAVSVTWAASLLLILVASNAAGLGWGTWALEDGIWSWGFAWTLALGILLLVSASSASLSPLFLRKPRKKGLPFLRVFLDGGAEHGMALWLLLIVLSAGVMLGVCGSRDNASQFGLFLAGWMALPPVVGRFVWQCALAQHLPQPNGAVSVHSFVLGALVLFFGLLAMHGHRDFDGLAVFGALMLALAIVLFIPLYMMGGVPPARKNARESVLGDRPRDGDRPQDGDRP